MQIQAPILSVEHLNKIYVFALTWGIGAPLENNDRRKLDLYLRENFADNLDLPKPTKKEPKGISIEFSGI